MISKINWTDRIRGEQIYIQWTKECTTRKMRILSMTTTNICEYIPIKASGESIVIVRCFDSGTIPDCHWTRASIGIFVDFKADVHHRINGASYVSATFAFNVTLQLTRESRVNYTVTRYVCRSPRSWMNLVQCRDEELMSILLCMTRELSRSLPSCGKKINGSVRGCIIRIDLSFLLARSANRTYYVFTSSKSLSISQQVQLSVLHCLRLCLSPRK